MGCVPGGRSSRRLRLDERGARVKVERGRGVQR